MRAEVQRITPLRFDDGSPVRAASAIVRFGDGWLVAQDDATAAAWLTAAGTTPLRLFPPVEGHDVFSPAAGTKHLKPDLEAACALPERNAALLLGSGSTPARMRAVLVVGGERPQVVAADLAPLYGNVAATLSIPVAEVNLEGACLVGDRLRWFQRGNLHAGVASASVDVEIEALVAALSGTAPADAVPVTNPLSYDLGAIDGVGLAVTDAVALPDGRLLLSAAAEDTPNAVDDGPVVAVALALLDGPRVAAVAPLPGEPHKVEGLAVLRTAPDLVLVAVVDADDPEAPSLLLDLTVGL